MLGDALSALLDLDAAIALNPMDAAMDQMRSVAHSMSGDAVRADADMDVYLRLL